MTLAPDPPSTAATARPPAPELADLLAADAAWSGEYEGTLANHLPMALTALDRMGAGADRLAAFARAYYGGHTVMALPDHGPAIDPAAWRARLGDRSSEGAWRRLFAAELAAGGRDALLARWLPMVTQSIAASAFHPIIRLGFALDLADAAADEAATRAADGEIAATLAYAAVAHVMLPGAENPGPAEAGESAEPAAILADLADAQGLGAPFPGDKIIGRMVEVAKRPPLAGAIDRLVIVDDTLDRLAAAARDLFAATGNFTALHGLTSSHALRRAWPYLPADDRVPALRRQWHALVCAWVTIGRPLPPDAGRRAAMGRAAPDWPQILAAAGADDDA
ncbi:MAG: DUF4243 domain-containing protein, partial [Alphaproteobacteria bacterium]|nr:DUF4243 domain-containing protein [Alphaproteobacteria bacterium]